MTHPGARDMAGRDISKQRGTAMQTDLVKDTTAYPNAKAICVRMGWGLSNPAKAVRANVERRSFPAFHRMRRDFPALTTWFTEEWAIRAWFLAQVRIQRDNLLSQVKEQVEMKKRGLRPQRISPATRAWQPTR